MRQSRRKPEADIPENGAEADPWANPQNCTEEEQSAIPRENPAQRYQVEARKKFQQQKLTGKVTGLIKDFFRKIFSATELRDAHEKKSYSNAEALQILRVIDLHLYRGNLTLDEIGVTPQQWKSLCEICRLHSFYALHAVPEIFGGKPMWKILFNLGKGFDECKFQLKLIPAISSQGQPIMIIESSIIDLKNNEVEEVGREIELMWDSKSLEARSILDVAQKVAHSGRLRAYTKIQTEKVMR